MQINKKFWFGSNKKLKKDVLEELKKAGMACKKCGSIDFSIDTEPEGTTFCSCNKCDFIWE